MSKSNVKSNVEKLLELFPRARNSDKYLILKYWELIDRLPMSDNSKMKDFRLAFMSRATPAESIRRSRQLIQQEGRFTPTDSNVLEGRKKRQALFKDKIVNEREVL